MVCALGAREEMVGRSHECDFPVDVVATPVLTRSRVRVDGTSADIDRDVREILRDVLTVYEVDVDALERAAPTVIVTQELCDVCAVSLADVERALAEVACEARIISLSPTRLDEVWGDIRRVGAALGRDAEAARVVAEIEERVAGISERARAADRRPTVLTIEWLDPVMIGGTWMPELVDLAGGEALVTTAGDHAPTLDEAALGALEPEVVLVKPCGFRLERTRGELELLRALLQRLDWPAWREGRVFLADGNAFFNRPGPRLVESLETLAACVHPDLFEDLAEAHAEDFDRLTP